MQWLQPDTAVIRTRVEEFGVGIAAGELLAAMIIL